MHKKNKIVMIGPVYPYKGGISHYTGMMYKALKQKYEVTMISYRLQYPKMLFKKEQKDYTNNSFQINNTKFLINTCNPFNWIVSAKKILEEKPNYIICQWWHPFFAPCYVGLSLLCRKIKWIFVCHNIFPHERFFMDKQLTKLALKRGYAFIVQSKTDSENLKKIIDNPKFELTVHPTYNAFRFENMTKETGRKLIGAQKNQKILLFFGFVREYKGLRYLLQAMPEIKNILSDVKLLIVGDFGNDKEQYIKLINQLEIKDVIDIYDGYIPDKEVEKYFAACDLVVLPYVSATQSGIVQIAYGFEKPVVVTTVGGLPDVVINGKTGYIVEPGNPNEIVNAIVDFYQKEQEKCMTEHVKNEAYRFSWDRMIEVIERLC